MTLLRPDNEHLIFSKTVCLAMDNMFIRLIGIKYEINGIFRTTTTASNHYFAIDRNNHIFRVERRKNLLNLSQAVEYKYLSNSSEWFFIARKKAEEVIGLATAFKTGRNTTMYV
jgi:hypothetical protein